MCKKFQNHNLDQYQGHVLDNDPDPIPGHNLEIGCHAEH